MSKRKHIILLVEFVLLTIVCCSTIFPSVECVPAEAILLRATPAVVKRLYSPYPKFKKKFNHASGINNDVFQIEPSDAILKFSQLAVKNVRQPYRVDMKVPSHFENVASLISPQRELHRPKNGNKSTFVSTSEFQINFNEPVKKTKKDYRHLNTLSHLKSMTSDVTISPSLHNYGVIRNEYEHEKHAKRELPSQNKHSQNRNNFTDSNQSLNLDSSSVVKSYELIPSQPEVPNAELAFSSSFGISSPDSANQIYNSSGQYFSTIATDLMKELSDEDISLPKVELNSHSTFVSIHQFNLTNNDIVELTTIPSPQHKENTSESISSHESNSDKRISSGVVAGIVIGVLIAVTALSSAVIYFLYRRFHGKCTSAVESKFNTDNCGYLDDSLHSSIYLNNHIELPKENSEEMTSLDNDSFLNSLETMTIQNYWADSSNNTKV